MLTPRFDIARQVDLLGADSLLPPSKYVSSGADISADGRYRYSLWREWRNHPKPAKWRWWKNDDGSAVLDGADRPVGEPESVLFVMLNPSKADADDDDPTIRKCVGFAKRWGYDRIDVVNLFAYRSTDPRAILRMLYDRDPVGVRNQDVIERKAWDAHLIVCAWGAHGSHLEQNETVRGWLMDKPLYALGFTKDGHPRHPLMLSYDTQLVKIVSGNER